MSAAGLRVLLAGATGLVGAHALAWLARDARVAQLAALQRRPGAADDPVRRVVADFERLDAVPAEVFAVDAAFCALGTTIATAGSQAAFRRVDFDYVLAFARRARAGGATRFALVSALGADPGSSVFYNRVKGEAEAAVRQLGFASLAIARPSLLLGERREHRPGERLAAPLMRLLPARWRAVPAERVAARLAETLLAGAPGERVLENAALLG